MYNQNESTVLYLQNVITFNEIYIIWPRNKDVSFLLKDHGYVLLECIVKCLFMFN